MKAQARAGRFSRRVGQRFDSLDALAKAASIGRRLGYTAERLSPLRDEAIACMAIPDMKQSGPPLPMPAGQIAYAHDAGLTRYAIRLRDGTVKVRRTADDRELAAFAAQGDRDCWIFALSADGRYLASEELPSRALVVWDADRNALCLREPGPVSDVAARFSPDSRQIATAHDDGSLLVYDLKSGQCRRRWRLPAPARDLAFRPDGKEIAVIYLQPRANCLILDADTGEHLRTFPITNSANLTWSPDGTTLAITSNETTISLWDTATWARKAILEGATSGGLTSAFHPTGTLLASDGWEGQFRLWDPALGRQVLSLTGGWKPEFSQDGRVLIAGN